MNLKCSSFSCTEEKPVEYCKECSHSHWIVRGKTTFNKMFGFTSRNYYKYYDDWLKEFEIIDIKKVSFE